MRERVWVKTLDRGELEKIEWLEGRWKRWLAPTKESGGMIFGMGELEPGQVAAWHEHPEPEIFFVLEGQGEALWKEEGQERRAELKSGCAFFKVGGVPHQMMNTGTSPLTGIFFKVGSV